MFLRALQIVCEKFDKRKSVKRFGTGHIFWHPDEARAKRLLEIEPPIVAVVNEKQVLTYVREAISGMSDPKTKQVIRSPIALESLDKEVQKLWHKKGNKAEVPGSEVPDADDEDNGDEAPKVKGKVKGKGKGNKGDEADDS